MIIWRLMKTSSPPSCCHRRSACRVYCVVAFSAFTQRPSSGVCPFAQQPVGLGFLWNIGFKYWCHQISDFKGKMHLIFVRYGSALHPTYSAPPDLYISVFKGPTSKVSEGEESSSSYLFPTCSNNDNNTKLIIQSEGCQRSLCSLTGRPRKCLKGR